MSKVRTEAEIEAVVREITDEEVAHYEEYGWVMLKQFVDPAFVKELYDIGIERRSWEATTPRPNRLTSGLALEANAEPYGSFFFSKRMEQNAQRLTGRRRLKGVDVPLRFRNDMHLLKKPGDMGSPYHQDASEHGSDRVGELQFWLALDEVTADMGAMRFVNRSHKEGPLGSVFYDYGTKLTEEYPNLIPLLGLSEPFHYMPGDCTVHHGYTIHGGPDNTTDKNRWSYLFSYTPIDTRYWNGTMEQNWGTQRTPITDDENNPLLS